MNVPDLGHATYFAWLVGCAGPILALQWVVFFRRMQHEVRAIFGAAFAVTGFLTVVDGWAIHDRVWYFDPALIAGAHLAGIPLEEITFFFLTALLVTQTMTLFDGAFRPVR